MWRQRKTLEKRKERDRKKRKTTYHTVTPVTNPNDSSKMVRPPCRLHDKLTSRLNKHWWKRETIQTSDWGQRISHQTTRGTNCADEQKRAVKLKETKSYWWPRHADREIVLIGGDGMNYITCYHVIMHQFACHRHLIWNWCRKEDRLFCFAF